MGRQAMGVQDGGAPDRYLLGDSAPELEHLVAQAEVYAEEARQLLDLIGVASGASAVDVGCGVLLNVARPQDVVAEMVRVARHGGVVALQEPDTANWLCDPPHPAFGALHPQFQVLQLGWDQPHQNAAAMTA